MTDHIIRKYPVRLSQFVNMLLNTRWSRIGSRAYKNTLHLFGRITVGICGRWPYYVVDSIYKGLSTNKYSWASMLTLISLQPKYHIHTLYPIVRMKWPYTFPAPVI